MRTTIDLYATTTGELLASVPLAGSALVNRSRRLLGGIAVPWNVPGQPSMAGGSARVIFRAGSVTAPDDLSWVKLLVEHDPMQSVGYLNEQGDSAVGLIAAYRVAEGPAGDAALDAVEARVRDALSVRVEVDRWSIMADETIEVLESRWRETSLVAVPAYAPARATVLASLPTTERSAIMAQMERMLDLKASAPLGTPPPAPAAPGLGAPDTVPPAGAPPTGSPQGVLPTLSAAPGLDYAAIAAQLAPHLARMLPAPVEPAATVPPAGPPRTPRVASVSAAAAEVVRWQTEGSGNVFALSAALNDVVPANDAGGGSGVGNDVSPQWLGELWQARRTGRPYIDSFGTPGRLTGLKAKGWKWVTRPEVADYPGAKAAIASNAVATAPAEADAHRTAGGWDVDRVFVDLGDAAFIESMFTAAAEDYARGSDSWFGAQLMAAAVANDADGLPAADFLSALIAAAGAAAGIGARLSFVAIAGDVFGDVAGLTKDQVPWWFDSSVTLDLGQQSGNITFRMFVDPELGAGEWLAGDNRAATYYEQGATPIRVSAVNIPNGGVDLGVFGYNAAIVNDERALFHGTIV